MSGPNMTEYGVSPPNVFILSLLRARAESHAPSQRRGGSQPRPRPEKASGWARGQAAQGPAACRT